MPLKIPVVDVMKGMAIKPDGPNTKLRPIGKLNQATNPIKKPPTAPHRQTVIKGLICGSVTP